MKNKIIYLVLLLLLSTATTPILAQEQCDTEVTQAQMDYMNATREARESFKASKLKTKHSSRQILNLNFAKSTTSTTQTT